MGVETESDFSQSNFETSDSVLRPCAGGMQKSPSERPFDPSAWYIAQVKRHNELVCRKILNDPERFPYKVEAYVAAQQELVYRANRTRHIKERVVISGKVFIRVDQRHRQDVLKQCLCSHDTSWIPLHPPLPVAIRLLPGYQTGRSSASVISSTSPMALSNTQTPLLVPTTRSRCSQVPSMASEVSSQTSLAVNMPPFFSTPLAPSPSVSRSPTSPNSPTRSNISVLDF